MKTDSKPFLIGKVAAAVSAVVLAGCLIKNEHEKKNDQSNHKPNLTHISTSKSALVDSDFASQPITDLRIKQEDLSIPVSVAALSKEQLNKIISEIELSRMGPEFFATSKSAPPKAVTNSYISEAHRGKTSQDINLTKLQQKYWKSFKLKIITWHKEKSGNKQLLNSQNAPVGSMNINGQKKEKVFIHSSKFLAPAPVDEPKKRIFLHSSKAPAFEPETTKKKKVFIHSSKSIMPITPEEAKKIEQQIQQKQK